MATELWKENSEHRSQQQMWACCTCMWISDLESRKGMCFCGFKLHTLWRCSTPASGMQYMVISLQAWKAHKGILHTGGAPKSPEQSARKHTGAPRPNRDDNTVYLVKDNKYHLFKTARVQASTITHHFKNIKWTDLYFLNSMLYFEVNS